MTQAAQRTVGDWATEEESAAALDAALDTLGLFNVYREVCGELMHPRPTQPGSGVRIDRVLVPTKEAARAGWTHGVVGIEAKRSGVKIGPPIAQAMDYSRAVFQLPMGVRVWLDFVFLWPMEPQRGTVASILAQNRIGSAHATRFITLQLKCGAHNLLKADQSASVKISEAAYGARVGSR